MIVHIDDPADTRLAPYRMVAAPRELAREGLFAAEGRLVLPRLLTSRYRTHSVLVSHAALDALRPLLDLHPDVDVYVTTGDAMSALGGVDFHRGCLALGHRGPAHAIGDILPPLDTGAPAPASIVILEGVSNPDNVGGIFRSAHAFATRAIVLGPGCADPLYRKSIRTSMGAALDVPWAEARDWPGDLRAIQARGYRVIALTTDADALPLADTIATAPVAFLLGSEGRGLTAPALDAADMRARISMPNAAADSLNVAAAASIALYEVRAVRE